MQTYLPLLEKNQNKYNLQDNSKKDNKKLDPINIVVIYSILGIIKSKALNILTILSLIKYGIAPSISNLVKKIL